MRLNKQQQQGKKVGSNCTSFSYSDSSAAAAFAGNKCNIFYECPIYCHRHRRHRWCIISVTAAEAQNKKTGASQWSTRKRESNATGTVAVVLAIKREHKTIRAHCLRHTIRRDSGATGLDRSRTELFSRQESNFVCKVPQTTETTTLKPFPFFFSFPAVTFFLFHFLFSFFLCSICAPHCLCFLSLLLLLLLL